jgi:hypothetical protein
VADTIRVADSKHDFQYAFGSDPNNLTTLRRAQIPIPDQVVYLPASTYYVRTDQSRVGDGQSSVSWIYDVISRDRLKVLLYPLGTADYAYTYVKSDKRDGNYAMPEEGYSVWHAIMWRPILSGQEGVPIARSPVSYQSVHIQFRLLEEHTEYL